MKSLHLRPVLFCVILLLAALFISPLAIGLMNSVKPISEIVSNPLGWPVRFSFSNYPQAWQIISFPRVMRNTVIVTLLATSGIVLLAAMVAYWSERHPSWYSKALTKALVASIMVPFVSIMLPLVQVLRRLGMANTLAGAIVTYWGIGIAFAVFVIRGAVVSLPRDLEEAARLDGYGPFAIFARIVLPLLAPTIVSVFVMDVFWIWNDFVVPLIVLNNLDLSTIQLAINRLLGMYNSRWDVALPGLVMSLVPIIAAFIALQKLIVKGVLLGAIKG